MRLHPQLKPIIDAITKDNPSLRLVTKPDPTHRLLESGGRRLRLEIWTPFLHVKQVDNHPRLYEFCDVQSSVQLAWFKQDEDGCPFFYLCSNSPLVSSEKVTAANCCELLTRLRNGCNWSVPW
jgi:hypothetical protein